jgi:DNA-binding LytR/AlgR family response regulator
VQFSYLIVDSSPSSGALDEKIKGLGDFLCLGICKTQHEGLNKILELKPDVLFLNIGKGTKSNAEISFSLLSELSEFLEELPYVIALSTTRDDAFDAYQRGISGFILNPVDDNELRKCVMRYMKSHKSTNSEKVCVKSQGDYHFIVTKDIVYLKADNNTTDFYMKSGKVITAYKTLKHFEKLLPFYFFRIHNSYTINIDYVSRINMGKSNCYLNSNEHIIPFSRTYKDNIDIIINKIA